MNKPYGILLLLLFSVGGCVNNLGNTNNDIGKELPRELTEPEEELVRLNQQFSYDLFSRITDDREEENVLISPLSISLALAMPLNGGFGETREEIQEAMFLGEMDLQEINHSYQSLMELLINLDSRVDMKTVSALWHREDIMIKEEFIEISENFFDSEVREVDTEDRNADEIINDWVSARTDGYIDHVVDYVSRYMIMQLINAACFHGSWRYGFDPEMTRRMDFHPESGSAVEIDMMERTSEMASYISDDIQMVDLLYGDSLFTMTLILPNNPRESIDEFIEESLTAGNVSAWIHELTVAETLLRIPKFELETEHDLKKILGEMGMDGVFEPSADFFNISDHDRLYLNDVKHRALVRVDERGVNEATHASMADSRRVILDRPFVFLIREQNTGAVLFMGKMENPAL